MAGAAVDDPSAKWAIQTCCDAQQQRGSERIGLRVGCFRKARRPVAAGIQRRLAGA